MNMILWSPHKRIDERHWLRLTQVPSRTEVNMVLKAAFEVQMARLPLR